jgi:hypothetical protein
MLEYELQRISSDRESTAGIVYRLGMRSSFAPPGSGQGKRFSCFTVEDQYRPVKVDRETRIPAGRYEIKLRTEGGMHDTYSKRFPWHRGMLWLQDVPNYTFVYLHTGNKESETDGCILTGDGILRTAMAEHETAGSAAAYERFYKEVVAAFDRREQVFISIVDVA